MRPQTIGLVVASVVTALFVAMVGLVLAWPMLTAPRENLNHLGGFVGQPERPIEKQIPREEVKQVRGPVVPAKDYTLSEPITHGNLTVYLIHGKDTAKNAKIITLQEGLERNAAIVHDNGFTVNIENRGNMAMFVQAGDIVKGGNQDRTVPYDMLVPANSSQPVAALCVEKGRCFPRANEDSRSFAMSTEQLPGRRLKLAAQQQSQDQVWNNVSVMQGNLSRSAGGSVQAPLSQTSLQLSLEHDRVKNAIQDYLAVLAPAVEGKADVIGYAVVVNGKIQSADVYASNALFMKVWPKLIRSTAVDALAERQHGVEGNPPDAEAVQAFLADLEKGQAFQVQGANRATAIRHETGAGMVTDTIDATRNNVVLHRSFLAK
jgi:hypothetical protein